MYDGDAFAPGARVKILVVGAGAVGGYFGARLLEAARQVTFLVRARRAAQLQRAGLMVRTPEGDLHFDSPPTVDTAHLQASYDLILLSCKAYDLESCIADFSPGMHERTLVLPLLNGMSHMDVLDGKFGSQRVLGGLARISSTLDAEGRIHQWGEFRTVVFGAREADDPARVAQVATALNVPGFTALASGSIVRDMWEKWVFIAAAAALTSVMRGTIGDIMTAGARDIAVRLVKECAAIAAENGYEPGQQSLFHLRPFGRGNAEHDRIAQAPAPGDRVRPQYALARRPELRDGRLRAGVQQVRHELHAVPPERAERVPEE